MYHVGQVQIIVQQYSPLRVSSNWIIDKNGTAIQLRGMSLYWSQWVDTLLTRQQSKLKCCTVIDAAISLGMYAIVNFHFQ